MYGCWYLSTSFGWFKGYVSAICTKHIQHCHIRGSSLTKLFYCGLCGQNTIDQINKFIDILQQLLRWGTLLTVILPGPSSTDKGFPVLKTGSPTETPALDVVKKTNSKIYILDHVPGHVNWTTLQSKIFKADTCFFIDLNGCKISFQSDYFSYKLTVPDTHLRTVKVTIRYYVNSNTDIKKSLLCIYLSLFTHGKLSAELPFLQLFNHYLFCKGGYIIRIITLFNYRKHTSLLFKSLIL